MIGMKIKEIIVVEGKNDSNVLKSHFDCDTIETQGTHLGKKTLAAICLANEKRGVIIFTDPDAPGNKIRDAINKAVPNCKNAFIAKGKAHTTKKVGVEHAKREDLEESLKNCMTYTDKIEETISWDVFNALGLNGRENSAWLRERIGERLFIGKANAKTLFKRLNMVQVTEDELREMIEEEKDESNSDTVKNQGNS